MKAIRIFLLVLIFIGLALIATQALWVPRVVAAIIAHDPSPVIVPTATSTPPTQPVTKPEPKPAPVPASGGVDMTATIGPTCPVVQNPPSGSCADKPYETTLVLASTITGKNGGVLIHTDAQGHFFEDLVPGTYIVRAQSTAALPRLTPVTFDVTANKRTVLQLQFDSGIR